MDRRNNKPQKKEESGEMHKKRCPFCGEKLRYRGAKDTMGTMYWKCRNKKCGRTVNVKRDPPKEVIPLTYFDKMKGYYNG